MPFSSLSLFEMSSKEESMRKHYTENFKLDEYAEYAAKVVADGPTMLRFELGFLYDVLKSGRFQGTSLLEIGSSLLVHSVANASAFYPRIIMSDYMEESCKELKKWLAGESTVKQFLDVPAELEGYAGQIETGKRIIEDRIRKCVKQVVRCDVFSGGIILEPLADDLCPPYDLIIQAYCAESVAVDLNSLLNIYKRINKLLRPGGGIFAAGFFEGRPWKVKNTEYHYLDITKDDLLRVLEIAGFGNVELKTQERLDIEFDYEELFCVAAEKIC